MRAGKIGPYDCWQYPEPEPFIAIEVNPKATVFIDEHGVMDCTCWGFENHGKCVHTGRVLECINVIKDTSSGTNA